ncbi:uncharacterized protein METZ01_LOCUS428592 [marine metagenome]|uniref:Uncharacterized protein n=1 Tax=marine metagenome TaxID=408172 RepID=A0A382XZP8_9ZZZZ
MDNRVGKNRTHTTLLYRTELLGKLSGI